MSIDHLIFVGLNGHVLALDRDTGEMVWDCSELKSGLVSLLLDGDRLIVSSNGYISCLDPHTGRVMWSNSLRGYGLGVAHLVSVRGQSAQMLLQQAAAAQAAQAQQHVTLSTHIPGS